MSEFASEKLACPIHKTRLDKDLYCSECDKKFPSANNVPVLINDNNSVFSTSDYISDKGYDGASSYTGNLDKRSGLRQVFRRAIYRLSENAPTKREFTVRHAVDHILNANPEAEILMIGSGDTSIRGDVTYTDVALGTNVQYIADAHDLPFIDNSFDAVIAVAVLEHVADPYACVDEMMRILRPGGYVFAETPFMQPVHMRQHDFTRFTYLGHRRLFRYFDDIKSGIAGGSGTSSGQLFRSTLASLSDRPLLQKWLKLIGLIVTYPLRWLDYISFSTSSNYDCASAFYFFGTLNKNPISDRELIKLYRGP